MSNNFRIIYLYIVCIITLSMTIGGIVSMVNNIASYCYPDSYVFFQENDYDKIYNVIKDNKNSDSIVNNKRNNLIERENYKNEKIKGAVVSIAVIVVGGIMYKYHWNIIEKERVR